MEAVVTSLRIALSVTTPISSKRAPAAILNCASTRSTPVTCSVTVCSTWMRGLHSMKK